MNIDDIDLNLLRVFAHLMVERRVSRTADKLGLSQPAVSNALGRLRRALGDDVFVATPNGMEPTAKAQALAPAVTQALGLLQQALRPTASFVAASSQRRVVLALTDVGEMYFVPPLLRRWQHTAPNLHVATVRPASTDLAEAMAQGEVDLALGLLPQLQGGFFQRRLFEQHWVMLMRHQHPLDRAEVTRAQYNRAQHVRVTSLATGHAQLDTWLKQAKLQRDVRVTVPHFGALGHLLTSSDLVATVPQRFAQVVSQPFGLSSRALPASLPALGIHMLWHRRLHRDDFNVWLRAEVAALFADQQGA
jgi:DNA-binding transcriptional LysR family regulator